ncbi:MAG: hypothetical protein MHPSP_000291 [Paramarteilia canceri]
MNAQEDDTNKYNHIKEYLNEISNTLKKRQQYGQNNLKYPNRNAENPRDLHTISNNWPFILGFAIIFFFIITMVLLVIVIRSKQNGIKEEIIEIEKLGVVNEKNKSSFVGVKNPEKMIYLVDADDDHPNDLKSKKFFCSYFNNQNIKKSKKANKEKIEDENLIPLMDI